MPITYRPAGLLLNPTGRANFAIALSRLAAGGRFHNAAYDESGDKLTARPITTVRTASGALAALRARRRARAGECRPAAAAACQRHFARRNAARRILSRSCDTARRFTRAPSACGAWPCAGPTAATSSRACRRVPDTHGTDCRWPRSRISSENEQELAAANKEFEALTSAAGHDLRGPLRILKGFAEALDDECGAVLNEEGKTFLKEIFKASDRMDGLIDGLLDFFARRPRRIELRKPRRGDAGRAGALRPAARRHGAHGGLRNAARHLRLGRRAADDDHPAHAAGQRLEVHRPHARSLRCASTPSSATA